MPMLLGKRFGWTAERADKDKKIFVTNLWYKIADECDMLNDHTSMMHHYFHDPSWGKLWSTDIVLKMDGETHSIADDD
jgi:hypothetical protein